MASRNHQSSFEMNWNQMMSHQANESSSAFFASSRDVNNVWGSLASRSQDLHRIWGQASFHEEQLGRNTSPQGSPNSHRNRHPS